MKKHFTAFVMSLCALHAVSQGVVPFSVKDHFTKKEVYIRMRDGVRLFTTIYTPKDTTVAWPILMERTPYSVAPYGADNYARRLGPNPDLMREGYIFVYQDVRGRYKSEGGFREMTPYNPNKKDNNETDESSDTWDTIEWLLTHVKPNNGRVGLYGISYPGFYATASLPGAHPAIKAVSPQAPVTDEFIGDDANHKGAFYLLDNFDFMNYFDAHRDGPVEEYSGSVFDLDIKDAYDFFLKLGPLSNSNTARYFNHGAQTWNEYLQHDTYDDYWKSRNIRTHLHDIQPATLVVGGWFDAEDLFGALETYRTLEQRNPGQHNQLVMGPWTHGAWAGDNWSRFTSYDFRQNVNSYYRDSLETPFFNHYLKDKGEGPSAEAHVFETGTNQWRRLSQWPPAEYRPKDYFLTEKGTLVNKSSTGTGAFRKYVSDPANPVPYTGVVMGERNNGYMSEDQRFLKGRKDVLTFTTDTLKEDLRVMGPITADIFVSTTGTDVDLVVKLIDVFPDRVTEPSTDPGKYDMKGMQRLVRAEPFRGKFRNSFEHPQPFTPGKVEEIRYDLPDVAHVFKKGHRIMVQVQSSWFPLVDRNPQTFVRIPDAKAGDYRKAEVMIHMSGKYPSKVMLPVSTGNL